MSLQPASERNRQLDSADWDHQAKKGDRTNRPPFFRSWLFLVQIFFRDVVLRHLARMNFLLVGVIGFFHPRAPARLERVSFIEQLVHAFRIRALTVGKALNISGASAG